MMSIYSYTMGSSDSVKKEVYSDGAWYEGEFLNDKINGKGEYTY